MMDSMNKRCFKCKEIKPLGLFYKDRTRNGGYSNKCKACERLSNREKRVRNPNTFKSKDEKYYKAHKAKISVKKLNWYHNNKHKVLAHEKVKRALFKGELERKSCEQCGERKSQAHHPDYSKPLDVVWLCSRCHMREHSKFPPLLSESLKK